MNNRHKRTHVSGGSSALQPVGSTANEAFHAELRAAFRQVYSIHAPILRLRLECLVLANRSLLKVKSESRGYANIDPRKSFLSRLRGLFWMRCLGLLGAMGIQAELSYLKQHSFSKSLVARCCQGLWSANKNPVAKPKKKAVKGLCSRTRGVCTSQALEHTGSDVATVQNIRNSQQHRSYLMPLVSVCVHVLVAQFFVCFSDTSIKT